MFNLIKREKKQATACKANFERSLATQEMNSSGYSSSEDCSDNDQDIDSHNRILLCECETGSLEELTGDESIEVDVVKPRRQKGLTVTFSVVEVRKYKLCVGENPAVTLGVPISIDWDYISEGTISLDEFEKTDHKTGKGEDELAIPSDERLRMVRQAGFTSEQIRLSVRAVNAAKMEREQTLYTLKNANQEEFMEKMRKAISNAILRRRSKKKERALLRGYLLKDAQRILSIPIAC